MSGVAALCPHCGRLDKCPCHGLVAASGDEFECEPIDLGVPASVDAERELEMEREVLGTSVRQLAADKVPLAGCEQPLGEARP